MTVIACSLAASIVFSGPSPTPGEKKCDLTDNACKARQYERKAANAATPGHRALYLHAASVSYLALFDTTAEPRHLCAARRTFDQSLAIEGQPDAQRASFEAARKDLVTRERKNLEPCKGAKRPHQPDPPFIAAADSSPTQPTAVADADPAMNAAQTSVTPSRPAPLPVEDEDSTENSTTPTVKVLGPEPLMPVAARPRPNADTQHTERLNTRPGRGLAIAGGLTLGAGLALAGTAGYLGSRLLRTNREAQTLTESVDGFASADQLASDDQLMQDYRRLGPQTIALTVAGGVTVVVAAVLLGIGGRRMAQAASRTALVPVPGGIALHARF